MDPECRQPQSIFETYPIDLGQLPRGIGMSFRVNGAGVGCDVRHILTLDTQSAFPVHQVDVCFGEGRGVRFTRDYDANFIYGEQPVGEWIGYTFEGDDFPGDAEDEVLLTLCSEGHFSVIPVLYNYALGRTAVNVGF